MNSAFISIGVVTYGQDKTSAQFDMKVRPHLVAAVNPITDAPGPEAKTIVYFTAESGMKPILSSEDQDTIIARASDA